MDPEEYLTERNSILTIAMNNSFPTNTNIKIMNKLQKSKLNKLLNACEEGNTYHRSIPKITMVNKILFSPGPTVDEPLNKFGKIPYLCIVRIKVRKQLRKYGICSAYHSISITRFLINNKLDKIDKS